MRHVLLALVIGVGGVAHADVDADIEDMISEWPTRDTDKGNPVFSFTNDDAFWSGKDQNGNQPRLGGMDRPEVKNMVAVVSGTNAAWFSAEVKGVAGDECAPEPCKPNRDPPLHVSGIVEKSGKDWKWVMWHVAAPVTAKAEAAIKKAKTLPDVLPKDLRKADEVVTLVEEALGTSDLGNIISDRKDAVMYGSAGKERFVGGAKIKKQLAKWKMVFRPTDGIQAGLVGSNLAWMAMNVDAVSTQRPVTLGTYRLTLFVEKTGGAWKVVHLHFSVDAFTYKK